MNTKKIGNYLFALMAVFVIAMAATPVIASAASRPYFPELINESGRAEYGIMFGTQGTKAIITNCKSTKPHIAKISKTTKDSDGTIIWFKLNKPGTAFISFKARVGNTTYTYKTKFRNWKYTNPIQTMKIAKVDLGSKFKNSPDVLLKRPKLTGTFRFKLKTGWKLYGFEVYNTKNGKRTRYTKAPASLTLRSGQILTAEVMNKQYGYIMYLRTQLYG